MSSRNISDYRSMPFESSEIKIITLAVCCVLSLGKNIGACKYTNINFWPTIAKDILGFCSFIMRVHTIVAPYKAW